MASKTKAKQPTDQPREPQALDAQARAARAWSTQATTPSAQPAGSARAAAALPLDPGDEPTTTVAAGDDVWTPWGPVAASADDSAARDPLEPDAPLSPAQAAAAARWGRRPGAPGAYRGSPAAARGPRPVSGDPSDPAPLTPRELFEMLMTPAAAVPARPGRASAGKPGLTAANPMSIGRTPTGSATGGPAPVGPAAGRYPAQANMILSALEAGQAGRPQQDRRTAARRPYRVRAALRLFSDSPDAPARSLYTRDVHARGLGFLSEHRLPLGNGGTIELPNPNGAADPVRIACTVLRCREAAPGWYEGSVCFAREHQAFDAV